MLWRHELKYVIDEATYQQLFFTLRPILHTDKHVLSPGTPEFSHYTIRSLYFDDAGKSGVFDKMTGSDPRHKFRIRIYNNSDQVIRLEKKIKRERMTRKQSCRLTREETDQLLQGNPSLLLTPTLDEQSHASGRLSPLKAQFYADIRTRLLAPALLVDYQRTPLVWPDGNVRITFDRLLSTGFYRHDLFDPAAALQPVLSPGEVILEVKFDHFLPDFIRHLLPLAGASPLSISKYVQCAALTREASWEDQIL